MAREGLADLPKPSATIGEGRKAKARSFFPTRAPPPVQLAESSSPRIPSDAAGDLLREK
jgi:hypothetical protein